MMLGIDIMRFGVTLSRLGLTLPWGVIGGFRIQTDKVRESTDSHFDPVKPAMSARTIIRIITGYITRMRTEMIPPGCKRSLPNWPFRPFSASQVRLGHRPTLFGLGCLTLFFALVFGAAAAQTQIAVCSDTPGTGERIECTEGTSSTSNIDINAVNVDIDTSNDVEPGIHAKHEGTGNITVSLGSGSTIDTGGMEAHGIYGEHTGTGDIIIDVQSTEITTTGQEAQGINARNQADVGNIRVDLRGSTVDSSFTGIKLERDATGRGAVNLDVRNTEITTRDSQAVAIDIRNWSANAIASDVQRAYIKDSTITTHGTNAHGIRSNRGSNGDIVIESRNADIVTEAAVAHPGRGATHSHGIFATHKNQGDIDIDFQGGSIETIGISSHGIVAYYFDTEAEGRSVSINVEGSINVSGANSQGVRVGSLSGSEAVRTAAIGADGYPSQTVTVNGPITSAREGVFLAGGGRVVIGPQGSIDSDWGIAILAAGTVPDPNSNYYCPTRIPPKLRVDLNLGGRRVSEAINGDWIINEGGATTIAVNNVVLHDGETGVTDAVARNGAWNVRMKEEGVNVTGYTLLNSMNWTETELATGVAADRDFSSADFNETDACPVGQVGTASGDCITPRQPICQPGQTGQPPNCATPRSPPQPVCQPGQTGTPRNCTTPPPRRPAVFMEEYAPRAAVYEALPGFLLRLNGGGLFGKRIFLPGSPVWTRFSGSRGSHSPARSTVGQEYDFERSAVETGLDMSLGENLTGSISLIHARGSAEVSSPVGGGNIEAEGIGLSIEAYWRSKDGWYGNGSLSLTDYDVDISSGDVNVGALMREAFARGTLLDFEAGRRIKVNERLSLAPRAWMSRSEVSLDSFTDAVDARISIAATARMTGGAGVIAETERTFEGGKLSLQGSLDLAQILNDSETATQVSGEELKSKSSKTRLLLGLGGIYRNGRFSVSGKVSIGGMGSDDTQYSGRVRFGMKF